jgi:hypothetical protein
MIQIECDSCKRKLRAPVTAAGKMVACPCGVKIQVAGAEESIAATKKSVGTTRKSPAVTGSKSADYFTHGCPCGRNLRVARSGTEKSAKCPCGKVFAVPAVPAVFALETKPPAKEPLPSVSDWTSELPAASPYIPPSANASYPSDYPVAQSGGRSYSIEASGGGGRKRDRPRVFGSAALYGCAMMLGAVVWFVGGLALNRIFFYPPVMFVLGFISFVRGLMDDE